METRLRHGDRVLTVRLGTGDAGGTATVDDAEHRVVALGPAAAAVSGRAVVETRALEIDGRVLDVVCARTPAQILVSLGGRTYVFDTGVDADRPALAGGHTGAVVAPMPGKVLAVLVAAGDRVEVGDPLVVLEAMKMENTLAAEVAGRVHAVHAVPGATVDAGAVLVEIRGADPAADRAP